MDGTRKEIQTIAFENYYNSFLDAKGQKEYIACLEKSEGKDRRKNLKLARTSLKSADARIEESKMFIPAEMLILDAEERFVDVDEKRGKRLVTVKRAQGEQSTYETEYAKTPP